MKLRKDSDIPPAALFEHPLPETYAAVRPVSPDHPVVVAGRRLITEVEVYAVSDRHRMQILERFYVDAATACPVAGDQLRVGGHLYRVVGREMFYRPTGTEGTRWDYIVVHGLVCHLFVELVPDPWEAA